jgi:uncharacterized protein
MLKRNAFTRNEGIFSLVSDVSVKLSFRQNENDEVTLNAEVSALVSADCQRCLELLEFEIKKSSEFSIRENDDKNDGNLPLEDGRDIFYANNGKLDVLGLVEDELLLAVPMIPKHENTSSCGAMGHEPDNEHICDVRRPFADLRELIDSSDEN